jgi:uncharacterized damage-inducible protein DinB
MTESQRESVPRTDTSERDTALAFLRFVRHSIVKKTQGLDDEQLRRPVVGTGTNLLGLVAHSTGGELYWFAYTFAGEAPEPSEDIFDMEVPADRTTEQVLSAYEEAVARSDAIIEAAESMDALSCEDVDDAPKTLRWIVAHMTGETARHAGHADILREIIDGTTGR